jgi:GTP cyclohydrolase I
MSNVKLIFDQTGLADLQKTEAPIKNIPLQKVGVNRVHIPVQYITGDGRTEQHDTEASLYVSLDSEKKGINMSRLVIIVHEHAEKGMTALDLVKTVLEDVRWKLRDSEDEPPLANVYFKLKFRYYIAQKSLASNLMGKAAYDCILEGIQTGETVRTFLTVNYEYSSTCPCSKTMAEQYMEEYAAGSRTDGNGTATAHAQRSNAAVTVEFDPNKPILIEDMVEKLREVIPTEVQVIVKRVDEQAFAILNGSYPVFCEDIARVVSNWLQQDDRVLDYCVVAEHFEALHRHNAVSITHANKNLR